MTIGTQLPAAERSPALPWTEALRFFHYLFIIVILFSLAPDGNGRAAHRRGTLEPLACSRSDFASVSHLRSNIKVHSLSRKLFFINN